MTKPYKSLYELMMQQKAREAEQQMRRDNLAALAESGFFANKKNFEVYQKRMEEIRSMELQEMQQENRLIFRRKS